VPPAAAQPGLPALAASSTLRSVKLAQLPAELRRELPALSVGGTMWSENVASRFLIIDGQVLREGEAAGPGLVLERIAQRAAWLRWREWRIELSF
jgi:general secretion pathway protein B